MKTHTLKYSSSPHHLLLLQIYTTLLEFLHHFLKTLLTIYVFLVKKEAFYPWRGFIYHSYLANSIRMGPWSHTHTNSHTHTHNTQGGWTIELWSYAHTGTHAWTHSMYARSSRAKTAYIFAVTTLLCCAIAHSGTSLLEGTARNPSCRNTIQGRVLRNSRGF